MHNDENHIGGFRILKSLKAGSGSQGTVYQAVAEQQRFDDVPVGSLVALKVMLVQDEDGSLYIRLKKRTAELVSLDHPNIVRYYGCFREKSSFSDIHVIVLQYIEGESLKSALAQAKTGLDADRALKIVYGLLDALDYMSHRGIVHRDLKPGNVILSSGDIPKLIDFEVSRRTDGTMTSSGNNMIGTFDYMAPDFTDPNFRGDICSDIFSFGVCLHEILCGRTPYRRFSGESSQANFVFLQRWVKAGSSENPIRISSRIEKITNGASEAIARMLAPNRADRFQTFAEVSKALHDIRNRELRHNANVWLILRYIGKGGCGEVFQARNRKTGAFVAIKRLLHPDYAERFRREAKTLARLNDPCFTQFVDFVPPTAVGASAYLVMAYLPGMPGSSLRDALSAVPHTPLDRKSVLTAFTRYAHGLSVLHKCGIIHRDIKPSNLYFPQSAPEQAVIMDLGIVRDVSGTATVGAVPGTIDYMPPESATSLSRGTQSSDIWALGLCLYEALTGVPAYPRLPEGQTGYTIFFRRVQNAERPDLSRLKEDADLFALVSAMCEIDPARRLKHAHEVESRLNLLNNKSIPFEVTEYAAGFIPETHQDSSDDSHSPLEEDVTRETQIISPEAQKLLTQIEANTTPTTAALPIRRIFFLLLAVVTIGSFSWFGWRQVRKLTEERARFAAESQLLKASELRHREELKRRANAEEAKRQADEAKRQAEEAKRRADAEAAAKRQAEEAKRQAEEAKHQAEEAKHQAEEAKRRADAEAAAKRQAEEAKRQAEEAKRRADTEAAAKRQAEEAKRRADAEAAAKRTADVKATSGSKSNKTTEQDQKQWANRFHLAESQFKKEEASYRAKMNEALRPGSIVSPEEIQRLQEAYIIRRKAFRALKKAYERKRAEWGNANTR